jgi:hypothetical protein
VDVACGVVLMITEFTDPKLAFTPATTVQSAQA